MQISAWNSEGTLFPVVYFSRGTLTKKRGQKGTTGGPRRDFQFDSAPCPSSATVQAPERTSKTLGAAPAGSRHRTERPRDARQAGVKGQGSGASGKGRKAMHKVLFCVPVQRPKENLFHN